MLKQKSFWMKNVMYVVTVMGCIHRFSYKKMWVNTDIARTLVKVRFCREVVFILSKETSRLTTHFRFSCSPNLATLQSAGFPKLKVSQREPSIEEFCLKPTNLKLGGKSEFILFRRRALLFRRRERMKRGDWCWPNSGQQTQWEGVLLSRKTGISVAGSKER